MGGSGATPGQRSALIMPNARLTATTAPPLPVRDLGSYLYEPAGAVIRAGVIAELGAQLDAGSSTRRSPTSRATGSAAHPSRSHLRFSSSCPSISRRCAPGCRRRRSVFWRSRNVASISTLRSYEGGCGWLDRGARPWWFHGRRVGPLQQSSSECDITSSSYPSRDAAAGVPCWHS